MYYFVSECLEKLSTSLNREACFRVTYFGDWKEDQKSGKGTMTWNNLSKEEWKYTMEYVGEIMM